MRVVFGVSDHHRKIHKEIVKGEVLVLGFAIALVFFRLVFIVVKYIT